MNIDHSWARMIALLVILAAIFLQSYNGRQAVVRSQRRQCVEFGREALVPILNSMRADEIGNSTIAVDPRQSKATRQARSNEASLQERALLQIDGRLDPRATAGLNLVGRRVIRKLQRKGIAFSCDKAYPSATPFQFFG